MENLMSMNGKGLVGGPGEVQTLDLMTASRDQQTYVIDSTARLATKNVRK
jgi:hypothetical protein